MSLQHSTYYYEQRLEQFRKTKKKKRGRPKKRRKKKHQYTSLFADLDGQLILATRLAGGNKSDNKMMIPTIKKAKELFNQIKSNDADKGYDAEYNHEYNHEYNNEEIKTEDHIKLKNAETPIHRTKGTNRKKAKQKTKNKKGRPRKNHRNKLESIIFTLKKVCGEHLTAKKATNQKQQTRFKIISYNAYRKTILTQLTKDFYATLKTKNLNVLSPLKGNMTKDCIFCKIISGESPSWKVYEDDRVIAFFDAYPEAEGHILVVSKKHFKDIFEIDDEYIERIASVCKKLSVALRKALGVKDINLIHGSGKNAQQDVFHFHMHIWSREAGDKIKLYYKPKPNLRKDFDKILKKIKGRM